MKLFIADAFTQNVFGGNPAGRYHAENRSGAEILRNSFYQTDR